MMDDPAVPVVLTMLVVMLGILASAVAALYWAASRGEFNNLEEKSHSIFGPDEPIGKVTDAFPGQANRTPNDRNHD